MLTADNYVGYDRGLMRSCIHGLAVGDAIGVPYEFCERGTFECIGMADGGTHVPASRHMVRRHVDGLVHMLGHRAVRVYRCGRHRSRCGYKAFTYGDSDCDPEDFAYRPECSAEAVEDD